MLLEQILVIMNVLVEFNAECKLKVRSDSDVSLVKNVNVFRNYSYVTYFYNNIS
jgi:hypothetical protein